MDSDPVDEPVRLDLPARIAAGVDAVRRVGPVFAVGGVVRDTLLGLPVDDWDFATASAPGRTAAALRGIGAVDVDEQLGRVAIDLDGRDVVFTTMREESDYGPDRRPAVVRFVETPERDATRRDFTVNALYVEPGSGRIVDPTGGLPDLRAHRLRVIGSPHARLAEDPLRILRAVRFEASRGLEPTPETLAAMTELAARCGDLSAERRFQELHLALVEPRAGVALDRLCDIGALAVTVRELAGSEARVRAEVVPLLLAPRRIGAASAWAVLLGSAAVAHDALTALHAPRPLRREVVAIAGFLDTAARWGLCGPVERAAALRAAPSGAAELAAALARVRGEAEIAERLVIDARARPGADLALPTGRDVLALGVPPGPEVGRILAAVRARADASGTSDPAAIRRLLEVEVARRVKRDERPDR